MSEEKEKNEERGSQYPSQYTGSSDQKPSVVEWNKGAPDFTRMSIEKKRKYYVCGNNFVTLSDIPTWAELHSSILNMKEEIKIEMPLFTVDRGLNAKVSLWRGDITHLEIDAVVSTSGYVTSAICEAGSEHLTTHLRTLEESDIEDAALTPGYQLPAKYVLHISTSRHLQDSYKTCLDLVLKHNIRSVAFPCLGTGMLEYVSGKAARIALVTTRRWLEAHRNRVDRIIFCVFDDYNYAPYRDYFFHVFPVDSLNQAPLSDERTQELIDEALESSSLDMRNVVSVITGLMASGKTWLLSRLFHQLPPHLYTSTGVAEQSFRGLLHHLINISSSSSWKPFHNKQMLELLACLFYKKPLPPKKSLASPIPSLVTVAATAISKSSPGVSSEFSPPTPPAQPPPTKSSTIQSIVKLVKAPKSSQQLAMLELVHMIDTGGQPELLENMPSLIHHSHLAILVLNLMFGLDSHPSIDYHEEGQAYKRVLPSQYSNRQIIQKLASTLQAKRFSQKEGQSSRLLVVATHRDCVPEGELPARVKAFDQALRTVLLPANDEELICFSANQIPFVLNLKDPDDDDMERIDLIRSKISESEVGEVVKTPGSFLVFEQELMEFAKHNVHRNILSLDECLVIGARLKMKPEVVEAALIFFHRQFTLLYFRHVLPNLVFTMPQTPLECINAVVRFSYKVESGEVKGVTEKLVSSLRDGIITEEILSHKQLTQCFIPGLYEPCDAIDLLCHTLTLAPLSREVQSTPDTSPAPVNQPIPSVKREKREYLMMSLRSAIPDKEVPQHLPPPSQIAPLVVQFTKNCVPLSCFSRTISCLLAMYNWKLSRADDGSLKCLSHNVVSLYKPLTPGQIALVDMGHSFQINMNIDGDTDPSCLCFQVRETIFAAINQVFELLNLAEIEVSPAFLCPCPRKPLSHTASPYQFQSQWLLQCSVAEKNVGTAQSGHKVWLDAPAVEQEKPSLPKLLRLKIPQKVGPNFMQFGILLLDDEDGMIVEGLRREYLGRCEEIVRGILGEWVRGRGSAMTWKSLTDTLRDCDLATLADHIESGNQH